MFTSTRAALSVFFTCLALLSPLPSTMFFGAAAPVKEDEARMRRLMGDKQEGDEVSGNILLAVLLFGGSGILLLAVVGAVVFFVVRARRRDDDSSSSESSSSSKKEKKEDKKKKKAEEGGGKKSEGELHTAREMEAGATSVQPPGGAGSATQSMEQSGMTGIGTRATLEAAGMGGGGPVVAGQQDNVAPGSGFTETQPTLEAGMGPIGTEAGGINSAQPTTLSMEEGAAGAVPMSSPAPPAHSAQDDYEVLL